MAGDRERVRASDRGTGGREEADGQIDTSEQECKPRKEKAERRTDKRGHGRTDGTLTAGGRKGKGAEVDDERRVVGLSKG